MFGEQPGRGDDLVGRRARDPGHDVRRVLRRDRRQALEDGPTRHHATVGEPDVAHPAQSQTGVARVRAASGVVANELTAPLIGSNVNSRNEIPIIQITSGEQRAGVVADQERRVRPLAGERVVITAVTDQQMDEPERERAVGTGADLKPHVGLVGKTDTPGIDHQQLGPARLRGRDVGGEAQEVAVGIRAPEHDAPAARDVGHGQRVSAEGVLGAGGVARPLAEMSGAADVRGPEVVEEPLEPALGVGERGAPGRALVEGHRVGSRRRAHFEQFLSDQVEGLVPAARLPAGIRIGLGPRAAKRDVHAIAMVVELRRCPSLDADGAAVGMSAVRLDRDHARAIRRRHDRTVHRAEPAVPRDLPHRAHRHRWRLP